MSSTTQITLLGTSAAAAAAWFAAGPVGAGILAGFLAGAATAGAAALLQHRLARLAPRWIFHALLASLLFKAGMLVCAGLLLHYVPALARAFDLRAFLLAFAAAVLLLLAPATLDTLRELKLSRKADPR
jgi:hypothetical protein